MCFYKRGCVVVTMAQNEVQKFRMSDGVLTDSWTAFRVYIADIHPRIAVIKHPYLDIIPRGIFVHMNMRNVRIWDIRKIEVFIGF